MLAPACQGQIEPVPVGSAPEIETKIFWRSTCIFLVWITAFHISVALCNSEWRVQEDYLAFSGTCFLTWKSVSCHLQGHLFINPRYSSDLLNSFKVGIGWCFLPLVFSLGDSDANGTLKGSWQRVISFPEVSISVDQHELEGRKLQESVLSVWSWKTSQFSVRVLLKKKRERKWQSCIMISVLQTGMKCSFEVIVILMGEFT